MTTSFLTTQNAPGTIVARIREPFLDNLAASDILRSELAHLVQEPGLRVLVVDLSEVKMLASSSLSALLKTQSLMRERGGELRLCAMPDFVVEIWRVMNLTNTILPVFESASQALAAPLIAPGSEREIMET